MHKHLPEAGLHHELLFLYFVGTMKLLRKRYRHNSHRMWPKSTLTHTTRRCKVRYTTQESHLPRPAVRGICDRCERSSKRGLKAPLGAQEGLLQCQRIKQSASPAPNGRGGSAAWASLSRLIRRHIQMPMSFGQHQWPQRLTLPAEGRASVRPSWPRLTLTGELRSDSPEKGLFKRKPVTLPLLINHRPLHSTHSPQIA